jgi:hypothetical protein
MKRTIKFTYDAGRHLMHYPIDDTYGIISKAFDFAFHSITPRAFIQSLLRYLNYTDKLDGFMPNDNNDLDKKVYNDIEGLLKTYDEANRDRNILLSKFGLEKYKKYVTENCYTKTELLHYMMHILKSNANITLDDYAKLITILFFPLDANDSRALEIYFDATFSVSRYINSEDDSFIKLILQRAQDLHEHLLDTPIEVRIQECYPFTDSTVENIVDWLIGDRYNFNEFKRYNTNSSISLFFDSIINAIVPQKFDLEKLMIKRWIQKNNEQLSRNLGEDAAIYIQKNIDEIVPELPDYNLSKFIWQTENGCYVSLGSLIRWNKKLPKSILADLRLYYIINDVGEDIIDDISISSLSASILRTNVHDVTIEWKNVEFFNSYIEIKCEYGNEIFTFSHRCNSSMKINSNRKEYFSYCNELLLNLSSLHCAVNEHGILCILNSTQVDKAVAYLKEAVSYDATDDDDEFGDEELETNAYLLSLKNKCCKYLFDEHDENYPVKLIKEKYYTHSGIEGEEDAAIFVLKEFSNDKLLVVYENERLARSTYVFLVDREKINEVTGVITKYFTSPEHNKRQHLINDVSVFERSKGFVSFKRVSHASFDTWKEDISYI